MSYALGYIDVKENFRCLVALGSDSDQSVVEKKDVPAGHEFIRLEEADVDSWLDGSLTFVADGVGIGTQAYLWDLEEGNTLNLSQAQLDAMVATIQAGNSLEFADGVFTEVVVTIPAEQRRADLLAKLASLRYITETAGLAVNGGLIKTDRESQAQLNSAYTSLSAGFITSVDWKAENGWVSLTLTEIGPLAGLVAQHVQACFSREKEVVDQIEALPEEDLATFNVQEAWDDTAA